MKRLVALALAVGALVALGPRADAIENCGKVGQCDNASVPFSGAEGLYLFLSGRSFKTTLSAIASYVTGTVPPPTTPGISLLDYTSGSAAIVTGSMQAGSKKLDLDAPFDMPNGCGSSMNTNKCGILVGGAGAPYALPQPQSVAVAAYCQPIPMTVDATSGSNVVTVTAPGLGLGIGIGDIDSGMVVTGAAVPANTTVLTFNTTLGQITLSNPASATGSTVITVQDPCTTQHYVRMASFDGNGGVGAPTTVIATAGPARVTSYNIVCITFAAPGGTNPPGYVLWHSLDNATWEFVQTLDIASSSGACNSATAPPFKMVGQKGFPRPWWIPNDPSNIAAPGQADWLATTVQGGGGSRSLQLATAATTSVTGARVQHDDTTGWLAWRDALNAAAAPTQGYVPPGGYRVRSGLTLTNSIPIRGEPGATIFPTGVLGPVMWFSGAALGTAYTPTNNFQEGNGCIPLSSIAGLNIGDTLRIQQVGPGGASQALNYTLLTRVLSLQCPNVPLGVAVTDPAPLTFSDAAHTETVTIGGAPAAGNTVQLSLSGDAACVGPIYTVLVGDTTTTIARNYALAWNASSCSNYAIGTHTGAVATFGVTSLYSSFSWSQSVTGGVTATLAAGTGYNVRKLPSLLVNTGIRGGLSIDGQDAASNQGTFLIGVYVNGTRDSRFEGLTCKNFVNGGDCFLTDTNYANNYDVKASFGSGGAPNITSFASIWLTNETRGTGQVESADDPSFGSQLTSASYMDMYRWSGAGTIYGRETKFGALLATRISNLASTSGSLGDIDVCCGVYRSQFNNYRASWAYGINNGGLVTFDAWARQNLFTNGVLVGSPAELYVQDSDINNTFSVLSTGTGGGFGNVTLRNSSTKLYQANGCQLAYSPDPTITVRPACQIQSGTWTPVLQGAATAGSTTYARQAGTWSQNEGVMNVTYSILTSGALSGATGNAQIGGLPQPAGGSTNVGPCPIPYYSRITMDVGYTQLGGTVGFGASALTLSESGSAVTVGSIDSATDLGNPVEIYGSCSYPLR